MNLKTLASRLARIEGQRNNRRYQLVWDDFCDQVGWPRSSVGDASCIEDLLQGLDADDQSSSMTSGHPDP